MNAQRYPLQWPLHQARTPSHQRRESLFRRPVAYAARWHSMQESAEALANELYRLGAREAVLSTNIEVRLDGLPRSNQARPADPGAAVYFKLNGRAMALACDRWLRPECNVWAIAKYIEALRGQARWGVGSVEQAFAGFALPGEAPAKPWHEVMRVMAHAPTVEVEAAYRALAKVFHPDAGGRDEDMAKLNAAYDTFKNERGLS